MRTLVISHPMNTVLRARVKRLRTSRSADIKNTLLCPISNHSVSGTPRVTREPLIERSSCIPH